MHLAILLLAVGLSMLIRLCWSRASKHWAERWQWALGAFLGPPLLLLATSLTVLGMGHHGTMLWQPVGWLGCHLALGVLAAAGLSMGGRLWQQGRLARRVTGYETVAIAGHTGRLLDTPSLFAAQVGLWRSELVVSQGLLQTLAPEQLEAVLSHEEAHRHYRDPLWFCLLGWVRQFTFWLPKTEALWQELLLLRELRADHWAAQRVDPLVLAESLLRVVGSQVAFEAPCAAFHETTSTRLEERIEFLLTHSAVEPPRLPPWLWLLPVALPLLTVPLHG